MEQGKTVVVVVVVELWDVLSENFWRWEMQHWIVGSLFLLEPVWQFFFCESEKHIGNSKIPQPISSSSTLPSFRSSEPWAAVAQVNSTSRRTTSNITFTVAFASQLRRRVL
jgi:hypothetical protein